MTWFVSTVTTLLLMLRIHSTVLLPDSLFLSNYRVVINSKRGDAGETCSLRQPVSPETLEWTQQSRAGELRQEIS